MSLEEVPWTDRYALRAWVEHHLDECTWLIVERLLQHFDFRPIGVPTTGKVTANLWKHQLCDVGPTFAMFQILVYHYERVPRVKVLAILKLIELSERRTREFRSPDV